jgi:hypothetical protein
VVFQKSDQKTAEDTKPSGEKESSEVSQQQSNNSGLQVQVVQDLSQIRVEPEYEGEDVRPLEQQDLPNVAEESEEEEEDEEELEKELEEFNKLKAAIEKKKAQITKNEGKDEETEEATEKTPEPKNSRSRPSTATKQQKKLAKKRKSDAIDKGDPIDIIYPDFEWARKKEDPPEKKQKISEKKGKKAKDMDAPKNATKQRVELNAWAKSLPKYINLKNVPTKAEDDEDKESTQKGAC